MPFYSYNFILTVVFAVVLYRAGVQDESPGLLWAALSVAISLVVWLVLGWGVLPLIIAQAALFIGIGVFRVLRER
jgi:hypothetical protein